MVGVVALLYWRYVPTAQPTAAATLVTQSGVTVWSVKFYSDVDSFVAQSADLPSRPEGYDYELWALPSGGPPESLGLLPSAGTFRYPLTSQQKEALAGSRDLAVTVEPSGGSQTGRPTGVWILMAPLESTPRM
jgi:anti-sigma-K factor RskA